MIFTIHIHIHNSYTGLKLNPKNTFKLRFNMFRKCDFEHESRFMNLGSACSQRANTRGLA